MITADLQIAISEAERFLMSAKKCKPMKGFEKHICDGKEAAACKRASLDLTRALTDLRHPYRKEATK